MDRTLWILLIYVLISVVGGWAARQAKKQRENPRPRRPRVPRPGESLSQGPEAAAAPQRSTRQSPEEIAAEIRRVMGLEREEAKVEVIEEYYEDEPMLPEPVAAQQEPSHGGHLSRDIEARHAGGHHGPGGLETRHLGHLQSQIGGRQVDSSTAAPHGGYRRPQLRTASNLAGGRRSYLSLDDMAQAFVTMEILGPPKALRDE